MIKENLCLRY